MTFRRGVSPIGWVNDDLPSLGAGTTLDTILSQARAIGFEGIELGHLFPRDPAVLRPIMERHGLAVIGGWHGMRLLSHDADAEIAAMMPHLDLLAGVGATVVVSAEVSNAIHTRRSHPLADRPRLGERDWPEFGRRLDRVAAAVADRGLRFAYHHHLGTVVETADDLDRLLDATGPGVALTLDTGHACYGGIDPVSVVRAHFSRIAHVHAKDVRSARHAALVRSDGSFLDGVARGIFTTPGTGELDFTPFLKTLDNLGYAGWIVVEGEQDPAIAAPDLYAAQGLATLTGASVAQSRR
ncbi:myo-inosose-2 dehydratase [Sphingomonadaceae bacterium OTU29THOMA1]|nr:myo-inosose-2 dehydratase [Sphingomonadaceae bacterium OTU29THOMA1]